jgi:RluA family pseudouridine synthase
MNAQYKIIYENNDFIVVSKETGIPVIRGRGGLKDKLSLYDVLKEKYKELFVVHRIDRDTSGLVIFAKNAKTHRELSIKFERREVKKNYLAVVWGKPEKIFEIIDKPLFQYGSGRVGVSDNGKKSVTEVEFLKEISSDFSLVEARPLTGRRHQIRVHLYSSGHPVVGDRLYGDRVMQLRCPRLMLHSCCLEFFLFDNHYVFNDREDFLDYISVSFIK